MFLHICRNVCDLADVIPGTRPFPHLVGDASPYDGHQLQTRLGVLQSAEEHLQRVTQRLVGWLSGQRAAAGITSGGCGGALLVKTLDLGALYAFKRLRWRDEGWLEEREREGEKGDGERESRRGDTKTKRETETETETKRKEREGLGREEGRERGEGEGRDGEGEGDARRGREGSGRKRIQGLSVYC